MATPTQKLPPWAMTPEERETQRIQSLTTLQPPKKTQRERNNHNRELGKKGESLISSSLKQSGFWRLKQRNFGDGTKCDFIAVHPVYGGYMLEVKTTDGDSPTVPYSWITKNERNALIEFERLIPGHAFIIGVWIRNEMRAFRIRWVDVRDAVMSGMKGSINMLDHLELAKIRGGWDMEWMKGGREVGKADRMG